MGRRIRVVGGPWPERIGCEGVEVDTPPGSANLYPFARRKSDETVVLLDADPLGSRSLGGMPWTCVLDTRDLEYLS